MNVGDVIEAAIWIDGRETPEDRRRFEADVADAMSESARQRGHILGVLKWIEKKPGDERVPPVPDHIAGPNVRLLVAEAQIVAIRQTFGNGLSLFTQDLEPDDLALLRRITRRKYAREYPKLVKKNGPLTDRQADTLINDLGPEAAIDTLRGIKRSDLI